MEIYVILLGNVYSKGIGSKGRKNISSSYPIIVSSYSANLGKCQAKEVSSWRTCLNAK